ncbi:sugar ABC transporter substrate-binding protein [Aquibacillus sp. 3ASR75-11]|uniref:Sugar ABC transporter substrate-binding protein n=1 Tax=Terrihalobacillus insolitus TaxID=2950438 RepID=A0A9X4AKC4_9BACI|nr:sugar ABC transporter substrate-binding protein [Terrihalobacillus insolitus]MDC3423142.1 sugar ABC transporter substrate-binding protein [Terrihalobacillus insolitus]
MKKISFLTLLLVIGLVVAGCSNDTSGGAEGEVGGEITVWAHPFTGDAEKEEEMWDKISTSFQEEYDAEVNIEIIPWANRDQKILTALAANNGPDVFYAIPDQMPQYADVGMLLELDPYLEGYDMDDFVDSALVSTTWKDKLYGLPILQSVDTLFYNKSVIEAIGEDPENLPETWKEFEAWAVKAKEQGFYATSFQGGGSMNNTLYPYIWQAGGDIVSADNEVLINGEGGVEAFSFINKMYKNGWIPEDSVTAMEQNALWEDGQMLAILGSGNTLANLQNKGKIDFVIGPPLKNKKQAAYGTTGMFVVPSNTDNPATAAEFVKTLTNAENQRTFNKVTQYIPARESSKDIFDEQPFLSQLASYTQYTLPGVINPKGRDIMPMIQAQLQAMLEGDVTPQEAADAAAEAIEGAVSQ